MSLTRDIGTVSSATLVSRVLALLRDMGVAAVLGAGPLSDAYFAALQIPNLFRRLLSEGALNGPLVPMWLRLRAENGEKARTFGEQLFAVALVTFGGFAIACSLFAPTAIHLVAPGFDESSERFSDAVVFLRFAIGYVAVAGLSAVAAAILNAESRVAGAAGSVAVFNLVLVGAVALVVVLGTGTTQFSGILLTFSFATAGCLQLALLLLALSKLSSAPRRLRFGLSAEVRQFLRRAVPAVIAACVPALTFIAGTIIVSSSDTAVSWLYYAYRIYEVPLGVVSVAVASVLAPRIAASVHAGDADVMATTQSRAVEIALGLGLPAASGLALLAEPIAGALFERGAFTASDTAAVGLALYGIAAGLPGHTLEKVLAAKFFAREETRIPMFAALFGFTVSVAAALFAFPRYGHVGVAASVGCAGWVSSLALLIALWQREWLSFERGILRRIFGIVMASAVMTAVLVMCLHLEAQFIAAPSLFIMRLFTLILLIPLGLGIYLLCLQLFGIARIGGLIKAAVKRG